MGRKSLSDKPLTPAEKQRRYRERLRSQGKKFVSIVVDASQPDPNQTDLVVKNDDPKIQLIKQAIDAARDNPKFYKVSNKDLVAFVQQLEEILK